MEKGKVSVLWMVLAVFLTAGLLWGLPELSREKLGKTEELRREIRVLNLMNGLDFTQEQMEIILMSAKEYQELMARFEHVLLNSQDEMEVVLEEIRSYLRENEEIPSQTVQKYHRLDRENREERLKIQEKMKGLARKVEECLEPHQLYQLREFVPCIIPPKGEKRIGQAKDFRLERKDKLLCQTFLLNLKLRIFQAPHIIIDGLNVPFHLFIIHIRKRRSMKLEPL